MKVKVMYHSRSGNTRKVAESIGQAVGEVTEAVPPAYPLENVGLLFLGAAVYLGKVDKKIVDFINTLNTKRVRNVALFSTTGSQDKAILQMKEMLEAKGIHVLDETFVCPGKTFIFFNSGRPSEADLQKAREFAKKALEKVKE